MRAAVGCAESRSENPVGLRIGSLAFSDWLVIGSGKSYSRLERLAMLSSQQEEYVLKYARVPEHIPGLMVGISQAEAFLREDFIFFAREDWVIFIGFPLERKFQEELFSRHLTEVIRDFKPLRVWFIAPCVPASFSHPFRSIESDQYYRLELDTFKLTGNLAREIRQARGKLSIQKSRYFSKEHETLKREFLQRQELPPRIRELYLRIPEYLAYSPTSLLISARDPHHRLTAFQVLDFAARKFIVYVLGCFSRQHYSPHASDLLFQEMIQIAIEKEKNYIHLGLGVNDGIRRFKIKWGGVPSDPYFAGEILFQGNRAAAWLKALVSR